MGNRFPKIHLKHLDHIVGLALLVMLACSLLVLGHHYLGHESFWFDEAGQIWLALGLHHYSSPLAPWGGFVEIWRQSMEMSTDPGGFSFLLRGWIALFGTAAPALRFFPYAFFLVSLVLTYFICLKDVSRRNIALFGTLFVFFFPFCLQYAFEVRPYSMENLGVTFAVLGLLLLREKNTAGILAILSFGVLFFLFSRYGFTIFAGAYAASILYFCYTRFLSLRETLKLVAPIGLAAILVFVLRFSKMPVGLPEYALAATFKGMTPSQIGPVLFQNLLTLEMIPATLLLILGFKIIVSNLFRTRRYKIPGKLERLAVFVFFSYFLAALLSSIGKMPWDVSQRWSLSFHALSAICLAVLITSTLSLVRTKSFTVNAGLAILMIFLAQASYQRARTYARPIEDNSFAVLHPLIGELGPNQKLFVPAHMEATVRQLFELGGMRKYQRQIEYPKSMVFETLAHPRSEESIADSSIVYSIYGRISKEELNRYQIRIGKPGTIVSSETWPNQIWKYP